MNLDKIFKIIIIMRFLPGSSRFVSTWLATTGSRAESGIASNSLCQTLLPPLTFLCIFHIRLVNIKFKKHFFSIARYKSKTQFLFALSNGRTIRLINSQEVGIECSLLWLTAIESKFTLLWTQFKQFQGVVVTRKISKSVTKVI